MADSARIIDGWLGKALGAAAALVFAPPDPLQLAGWVLAGIALGQLLDRVRSARRRPLPEPVRLQLVFAALGHIAKAGGVVRPAHIHCAEALLLTLSFDRDERRRAIAWFRAGKTKDVPFAPLAPDCLAQMREAPATRAPVLESLCRMALLEMQPDAPEAAARRAALDRITVLLGFAAADVGRTLDRLRGELAEAARLSHACEVLGVSADAPERAVRLAYRRLVGRSHPDRLPRTANRGEVAAAEARVCDLRTALEQILASRERARVSGSESAHTPDPTNHGHGPVTPQPAASR
ncbi:MAG: hypothetical protein R3E86_19515 [Pseudomonadales bacterium]